MTVTPKHVRSPAVAARDVRIECNALRSFGGDGMGGALSASAGFEAEVAQRFGLLPNFFRSARAAPELIEQLWGFAKAGYLDNPMPSVFKERLFVWLSRFCPMRYCIVRHVGFLLGQGHGHASGDHAASAQTVAEVVSLLRRPSPWLRNIEAVYADLERRPESMQAWPSSGEPTEDLFFACAAVMFVEPARSARARGALRRALGARRFEYFCGCLAFIRTAHYWTMLHPEIESEEDMISLLGAHEGLARLLIEDPEADRCEMGERLYEELSALRELHERQELERAKRALEEKDRQKDQFIAVLAHELRNPLAAIRSAADAMKLVSTADERSDRLLQRLDRQSTAMARMLDDLLDASRIALGKVAVELKTLDLVKLLQEVLEEQQSRVREAGLMLEVHIEEKQPYCVKADQVRLRQVIDNLLSNAIKFTPAGGAVRLTLEREDGLACVSVRDTGVGFDEQFATELFEPFTQEEHGPGRPGGGLGLGLAIASRLARLQGGSLSGESGGLSQGAMFTLRIPLAPELNDGQTAVRTAPQGQRARGQVLLVEDNVDVADSLADLLELSGFQVRVARTGADAMRAALHCIPDVILCDLGLPGDMDGCGVASACRANVALRSVRLIAASGYSSPEHHAAAKAAGFERLLIKPLTSASLTLLAQDRREK